MKKIILSVLLLGIFLGAAYANGNVYVPSELVDITEPSQKTEQNTEISAKAAAQSTDESDLQRQRNISQFISDNVGYEYFTLHFTPSNIDKRGKIWFFHYNYSYGPHNIDMFVGYDFKRELTVPQFSNILLGPHEILFSEEDTLNKAKNLALIEPFSVVLVYLKDEEVLAWRVDRTHEPTMEERKNEEISGHIFSATNGDVVRTLRYHIEVVSDVGVPPATPEQPKEEPKAEISLIAKIIEFLRGIWRAIFA